MSERARYWLFFSGLGAKWWVAACAMTLLIVAVAYGGSGTEGSALVENPLEPAVYTMDETCRLASVWGDASGAVTAEGVVVLVADGPGLLRSEDGGLTFVQVSRPRRFRWPSVVVDSSRVWVSWVQLGKTSVAMVAALGTSLGLEIPVFESTRALIDTELVALGGGRLLLFVTEIEGPLNKNGAVYTIHCFESTNGGLTWESRSMVTTAPRGVNLEDARAVALRGGEVLLAFEWEDEEGGASEIRSVRSPDGGVTWSRQTLLWGGEPADREPGGFGWRGDELWFVASTDEGAPGLSYAGARISLIRSRDGGLSWSRPKVLVDERSQLAMGVIVVDHAVLLPSIRNYDQRSKRSLALYRVDPIGRWRLRCDGGLVDQSDP